MRTGSTTTRREFLIEAAASSVAMGALASDVLASQQPASQVVGMTTMDQLKGNIALARGFKPMPDGEQTALVAKVKPFATDGRFEHFKSTQNFDGPVHRRQHGFQA